MIALWCAAFADAPEDDPEMIVLTKRAEFSSVWAAMVLALNEMSAPLRAARLASRNLRHWLYRLAREAEDQFGPAAEIWMEWRGVKREMEEADE